MLKLTSEKTEFIIFASKQPPGRNITPSLPWHVRDINISSHVRSRCVIFYSELSFAKHIDYIFNPVTSTIEMLDEPDSFSPKKLARCLLLHW